METFILSSILLINAWVSNDNNETMAATVIRSCEDYEQKYKQIMIIYEYHQMKAIRAVHITMRVRNSTSPTCKHDRKIRDLPLSPGTFGRPTINMVYGRKIETHVEMKMISSSGSVKLCRDR